LERGVILADLFPKLADAKGNLMQEYSDDGVHLTAMGYRSVALTVLGALSPFIERLEP
jgi:lysophospholipase L1-like esterase